VLAAPGDDLVHVRLVPCVPHDRVGGRLEHAVDRERQFDRAQVRAQVPGVVADGIDDQVADLAGEGVELGVRQTAQVARFVHALEEHGD
jgi:phosphoglycolate phosphatase-like HAD superfamily hydrolase